MFSITLQMDRRDVVEISIDPKSIQYDPQNPAEVSFEGEVTGRRDVSVTGDTKIGQLLGDKLRDVVKFGHVRALQLVCGTAQNLPVVPTGATQAAAGPTVMRAGVAIDLDKLRLVDVLAHDQRRHLVRLRAS